MAVFTIFCRFWLLSGLFKSCRDFLCFDGSRSVVLWISFRLWYSMQHPQYRGDASTCLCVNVNCSRFINHESLAPQSTFTLQRLPPHRTQSQSSNNPFSTASEAWEVSDGQSHPHVTQCEIASSGMFTRRWIVREKVRWEQSFGCSTLRTLSQWLGNEHC